MNYRDLKWSDLRAFATSQDINTKGKKKVEILEELDSLLPKKKESFVALSKLEPFKGVKELPAIFEEIKDYLPALKAYQKIKAYSNVEGVSKGIAELFMKHIETDKNAVINLAGCCIGKYYPRLINGYNKLCIEYGEPTI